MIFKYNYLENHNAAKLHELAKHIVLDVWCNAQGKNFKINKIKEENDFRVKVNRTGIYLKKPIHEIFKICSKFNDGQIQYIKDAFNQNNQIKELCENRVSPVFYDDLSSNTSEEFSKKVHSFFNNLYEKVFKQDPFCINNHYDEFFQNNKALCPFCGLKTLEKDSSNHRDDYDHYLPKEKYPFNAVNLKNLLPMCSDCNKKWKKVENPISDGINLQKVFYYFGTVDPDVEFEINIHNSDLDKCDLSILLKSSTMQDKVNSWDRLFSLTRRYKDDVICHEDVGKGWVRGIWAKQQRAISHSKVYDVDNDIWEAEEDPISNKNFLKAPFLKACKESEII